MTKRQQMGWEIMRFEGRFDKEGNLMVYKLPAGDGGGSYEIAGINERYHPKKAAELKKLIESGQNEKAKEECAKYLVDYTDSVLAFFPGGAEQALEYPHIEFLLRDSCFNRGAKGAATILQLALEVDADGVIGPTTRAAFARELKDPDILAVKITQARERYERTTYPWKPSARDESSKFWKGLSNRWDKAHEAAMKLV